MLYILNKQEQIISTLSNKGNMNKVVPYFEDIHIEELDTGVETFEFKTISNSSASNSLQIGNYVAFKDKDFYKIFQIKEVKEIHAEQVEKTVYCEGACLELLNEIVRPMEINSANLRQFLSTILDGTSWSIGMIDAGLNEVIPVSLSDYDNVYKVIQDVVIGQFGGEIRFRVELANNRIIGKYIDVFARRGRVTRHRFEYGVNMTSVEKTVDSSELVTALIGVGKDDITFKEVEVDDKPKNQDFIISEDAYNRWNNKGSHIMGVFNCESESPQELLRLTRDELKRRSEPKITYNLEVELLGDDVDLGDEVFVIDNEFNPPLYLSARVSKLERSKTDTQSNRCTLANFKEVKSSITSDMRALASSLEGKLDDKINKKFPIDSQDIKDGAVTEGKIESQYLETIKSEIIIAGIVETEKLIANKADITDLEATNATIENLKADKADVDSLNAVVANIETLYVDKANVTDLNALNATVTNLEADKANISDLNATNATIENLKVNKADIDLLNALEIKTNKIDAQKANISDLEATNATIANLQANKAEIIELNAVKGNIDHLTSEISDINTLVNGNLTSDNIHSLVLTSDKITVEDAFIKNAMIDEINANKIRAGEINTSAVTIASPSGGITIANNTQQFKDKNNKVRVQIGEDKNGEFNFSIYDETGTGVLIDHTGVKEGALSENIIKEDMISEDAVGEKQINYNSFATGFNKDTNTNTLKATKVKLDNTNQTLEVGFSELKTQADDTKSKTESNIAKLEVQQGQIQGLISDTTIEKDGQSIKIKDAYSEMEQTVNSFGVTIGEQISKITEIGSKADDAIGKATNAELIADGINGRVLEVESSQSKLEQNLDGFKSIVSKDYSTKAELKSTNDKLGKVEGIVDNTSSRVTTLESNLDGITQRVGTVEEININIDEKVNLLESWKTEAEQKITDKAIISTVSSTIDKKIESVSIGGENLLRDYQFSGTEHWKNSNTNASVDLENDCAVLTARDTDTFVYQELDIFDFKEGDELTVQYEIMTEDFGIGSGTDSTLIRVELSGYDEGNAYISDIGIFGVHEKDAPTSWKKYVSTVQLSSKTTESKIFKFRLYARNFVGKVKFRNVKLERGNKATDLSPSSLDVVDALTQTEKLLTDNMDKAITDSQTNILNNIADNYASIDNYNNLLETFESNMEQTDKNISMQFTNVQDYAKKVDGELQEFKKIFGTYINFSNDGIDLGKIDSPFTATLDNTKLAFKQDGDEVAYISNNKMHITNAEIKDTLRIGKPDSSSTKKDGGFFTWIQGEKGNLSLKWSEK